MAIFAGVVAIAALVGGWLVDRRRRVYADLGTTPAAAVFAGRNEVKGRAWHPSPLDSHLSRTPSVWWTFTLEEEREHTRTVTSTDSKGKTSTRTETYRQWHEIDTKRRARAWLDVVDDSGSVRVKLDGATIVPRVIVDEIFRRDDDRGFLARMVDNRTGRYRHVERAIAVGDELYVVGEATLRSDVVAPEIAGGDPHLVSTRTEESHRRRLAVVSPLLLLVGVGAAAVATGTAIDRSFGPLVGAGVAVAMVVAGWSVVLFNRLQLLAEQAARAWSLIDVQLTRRHDLIPRLAAVAEGLAAHERAVQEAIALARATPAPSPPAAPTDDTVAAAETEATTQTTMLRDLLAVIEAYPDLTAADAFTELREQLADTESRIAGARAFYNDSVTLLRNRRQTFPGILVARVANRRRFPLFVAEGFDRTVPPIDFDFDAVASGT